MRVLGGGCVHAIGQQMGLPARATFGRVAAVSPMLVDQLTPKGQINNQARC